MSTDSDGYLLVEKEFDLGSHHYTLIEDLGQDWHIYQQIREDGRLVLLNWFIWSDRKAMKSLIVFGVVVHILDDGTVKSYAKNKQQHSAILKYLHDEGFTPVGNAKVD
jgi:hypothetical protein